MLPNQGEGVPFLFNVALTWIFLWTMVATPQDRTIFIFLPPAELAVISSINQECCISET
jgi:hypothetical protein